MDRPNRLEKTLQDFYSQEASGYDSIRYESRSGAFYNSLVLKTLDAILAKRKIFTILDVPMGTGRILMALTRHATRVYGVDIAHNMLLKAAERAGTNQIDGVRLQQCSIRALPFKSNAFDAVVSLRFLHLIFKDDYQLYLNELKRVLKPNGLLIVEFANAHYGLFLGRVRDRFCGKISTTYVTRREIESLLSEQGLTLLDIRGVAPPLVGKVAKISKRLASWYARSNNVPPLKFLTYETWAICTKP